MATARLRLRSDMALSTCGNPGHRDPGRAGPPLLAQCPHRGPDRRGPDLRPDRVVPVHMPAHLTHRQVRVGRQYAAERIQGVQGPAP